MYWTLSEIRGLEAGGGWRGWWRLQRTVLAGDCLEAGICSQHTSSCSSLHSGRILNTETIRPILHPFPLLTSFSIIITFYLSFFLHQSKRFSFEKSDILRGNLLMWDRPGCNIGWRRWSWIHYFPAATSRCTAAEATPTLFIINLEHFYLAQSYNAFYSAMNVILLPSFAWLWLPVVTSDYQWLPDQYRNSVTCDETRDSQNMNSQMSR